MVEMIGSRPVQHLNEDQNNPKVTDILLLSIGKPERIQDSEEPSLVLPCRTKAGLAAAVAWEWVDNGSSCLLEQSEWPRIRAIVPAPAP